MMNTELDDRELFDRWVKGDASGFAALYERHKNRVYGFLLRMTGNRETAEDLMQETFLAAHRNLVQFDRNRVFLSWIFGIAHKRTIDYFRHLKVENEHRGDTDRSVGSRLERADEAVDKKKIKKLVAQALETLDPNQREVFLLRELGGVPFKEIAAIMDCPLNTALGRMRLALINIRKDLKKRGVESVH